MRWFLMKKKEKQSLEETDSVFKVLSEELRPTFRMRRFGFDKDFEIIKKRIFERLKKE